LSDIEAKLEAIEDRYRKESKQYEAARYIVRQSRPITTDERKAMVKEIPIKYKTLQGVFTELRKMGVYPPQKTSDIPKQPPATEKAPDPSHHDPEDPRQPQPEYATKEDFDTQFETLRNSINYLASVIGEESPSNPGELASVIRGEAPSNLDESEEEEYIEVMYPEELFIQEGSSTRQSILLKPKTQILYDATKDGLFGDYPGTRETDPFARWKKGDKGKLKITWSDFFNILAEEFYFRLYDVNIELTTRRRL